MFKIIFSNNNNTHKNKRIFSSDLDKSYRREKRVDHSYLSSVHVKSIFFFFFTRVLYVSIELLILNSQHRSTLRLQVIVSMEGVFSLGYKNRYCMKRLVWSENFFFSFVQNGQTSRRVNIQSASEMACKFPFLNFFFSFLSPPSLSSTLFSLSIYLAPSLSISS